VDINRPRSWHGFAFGIRQHTLRPGYARIYVNRSPYYYDDGIYYQQMGDDYQEVYPPFGAIIEELPDGAIEINAEILLKATKVNGIYDSDPVKNPDAKRYARLTFDKVLSDRLNVMDATAIVMCRENNLPLQVFNLFNAGDLMRIVLGEDVGTVVTA